MRILLQEKNKIFAPYHRTTNKVFVEYKGAISENDIASWLKNRFQITLLSIDYNAGGNDFAVAMITHHGDAQARDFLTFATVLKLLSNDAIDTSLKEYIDRQKLQASIKLRYGLRDGKIISIDEVLETEKGLNCNCYCPGCGLPLQARIGNGKRQRHFAHNNESCNITAAHQSALHMLAKEIIEQEKKIKLPAITIERDEAISDEIDHYYYDMPRSLEFTSAKTIVCDKVILEKKLSDIIPDIIVEVAGKKLLIEIAVTHFIDEEKRKRIEKLGLPVIEIDLSSMYDGNLSRADLRKIIVENTDFKSWIYNPKREKALCWAKKKYEETYRELKRKEEAEKQKELKKQQEQARRREMVAKKTAELSIPENYRSVLLQLRNDEMFLESWKRRSFYNADLTIPFYMDIPITGEMIFDCDRRIWQSAIFDQFVYNRRNGENDHPTVHIMRIQKWATTHQRIFRINRELDIGLLYHCIKQYLEYLSALEFVSPICCQEADVLCSHDLMPPNQKKAAELKAVLKKVDMYACDVTDQINALFDLKQHISKHAAFSFDTYEESAAYVQETKRKQKAEADKMKYDAGFQEIVSGDYFSNEMTLTDSFGYRWLVCTECGQIKREDEMVSYSGKSGMCRECSRT